MRDLIRSVVTGIAQMRNAASQGPVSLERLLTVPQIQRAALEDQFVSHLRLRNGVFKTTARNRLDETIAPLVERTKKRNVLTARTLDVGCSSGVSTLELHEGILASGLGAETFGTDLMIEAIRVRRSDGCSVLFDRDLQPLQFDIGDWATGWDIRPRKVDLILRPHQLLHAHALRRWALSMFRDAIATPTSSYEVSRVSLVSEQVRTTPNVTIVEEDIRQSVVPGRFDIIRAANVLNLDYFTATSLRTMVRGLVARLELGGLFMVVRTIAHKHHGTLFQLQETGLKQLDTLGRGSEIADLVLSTAQ